MLMPAVSGEECARVLSQLGFDVTMETRDVLRMEREWHWVEVPRVGALDEDTLCRVLRCARLTRVEFLDALENVSMGKMRVVMHAHPMSPDLPT